MNRILILSLSILQLASSICITCGEELENIEHLYECFDYLSNNLSSNRINKLLTAEKNSFDVLQLRTAILKSLTIDDTIPVVEWFENKGVFDHKAMAHIIVTSFIRHLKSEKLELENQIFMYQEYCLNWYIPTNAVSKIDSSRIDFIMRSSISSNTSSYLIHLGISISDGSPWAYSYDRGIFIPDNEQLKEMYSVLENTNDWSTIPDLQKLGILNIKSRLYPHTITTNTRKTVEKLKTSLNVMSNDIHNIFFDQPYRDMQDKVLRNINNLRHKHDN